MKFINESKNLLLNSEIPDIIIKIITQINQTIFKYIKENINNIKYIEKKLSIINISINEILQKEKEPKKYSNLDKLLFKSYNNNIMDKFNRNKNNFSLIENNKNIASSTDDIYSNKYLTYKLKKRLKHEHYNNKIRELNYLERIAILQCKLNLYQKNFEKFILDNNNFIKNIFINNSSEDLDKNNKTNNNFIFNIKKLNNGKECQRNLYRPLSCLSDAKVKIKKKNFGQKYIKIKSLIQTYMNAYSNGLENYSDNNKLNRNNSLNNFHYKYQLGNNYLRNDFNQIKKTIHENNNKISKFRIIANKFRIVKSYN